MEKFCEECGEPVYEIDENIDEFLVATVYCCSDEHDYTSNVREQHTCDYKSFSFLTLEEKDKKFKKFKKD